MIDVGRVAPFQFPGFAKNVSLPFRHHQHGRHAERVRRFEVARQILEHGGLGGIDVVPGEESLVDLRQRLGIEIGGGDVEHVLEMVVDFEPLHHRVGVLARAVGEDELAARQLFERGAERRIGLERRMVDLVHELEIVVRLHAMLGHHSAHGGAVAPVIVLLHAKRLVLRHLQEVGDIGADALVDLLPEIEVMRVERVVEIEHPGLDVAEAARRKAGRRRHDVTGP